MDTMLLGRLGEAQTAEYLRRKGYRILAMNYKTRFGEIDVIAADRHYLTFVEVKLRRNASFAQAREFVTPRKQQRIILAAESWLQKNPTELQPRFDVAEVYTDGAHSPAATHIEYIENAF